MSETKAKTEFGPLVRGIGWYILPSGDKRWRVVYRKGPKQRSKGGFLTEGAADHWRSHNTVKVDTGEWVDPGEARTKFGPYATKWFANARAGIGRKEQEPLKPKTQQLYDTLLRNHILPTFENWQFQDFDRQAIKDWLAHLHAKPAQTKTGHLSPSTVAKAYRLLHQILDEAVRDEKLMANPCTIKGAGSEAKPDLRRLKRFTNRATVRRLADHMRDEVWWDERGYRHHRRHAKYRALILLGGLEALRWGEAIALERRHIDLINKSIEIEQQILELGGELRCVPYTKTGAGCRTHWMEDETAEALRIHLAQHVDPSPNAVLFAARTRNGRTSYLRESNWRRSVWLPAVEATNCAGIHFHDLRHIALTMIGRLGIALVDIMEFAGHANERAAMRYQHADDSSQRDIAARRNSLSLPADAATGTDDARPANVVQLRPRK